MNFRGQIQQGSARAEFIPWLSKQIYLDTGVKGEAYSFEGTLFVFTETDIFLVTWRNRKVVLVPVTEAWRTVKQTWKAGEKMEELA